MWGGVLIVEKSYTVDHVVTGGGNCTAEGKCWYDEVSPTLKTGGVHATVYAICAYESNAMKSSNPHSGIYEADTSRTLDLNGGNPACNQGGEIIVENQEYVVRRLTPLECTRLQGFPDGWVDIGEWTDNKGKKHKDSDAPKYKALGNSIALPFWAQLLRKISDEIPNSEEKTLGSLFDGISGFPFCWAEINGADTCRWSSEIEDFPIAVVTKHFGDEDKGIIGDIDQYLGKRNGENQYGN